jgi:hypothetical protein
MLLSREGGRPGRRPGRGRPGRDAQLRNGVTDRELLLRAEAVVVLGRDGAGAARPPDLCDSYNLTPARGLTAERRATARGTAALRSRLPTSCLRTTGVLDRRDVGRPGCCYRPERAARSTPVAWLLLGRSSHRVASRNRAGPRLLPDKASHATNVGHVYSRRTRAEVRGPVRIRLPIGSDDRAASPKRSQVRGLVTAQQQGR